MCGVVGISSNESVATDIYDALTMLQHRGQDAIYMHPADKDTSIGKRGAGGAQARNINIDKRATNRPPSRRALCPGKDQRRVTGIPRASTGVDQSQWNQTLPPTY